MLVGEEFCEPENGGAGGRPMGREGNQRRCSAALYVAKDSEIEISMIVLLLLEAWPTFCVSYTCLEVLLLRTLEKMTHRGLTARASGSLNWAGLLPMASQAEHFTTPGSAFCKTMTCMAPPRTTLCRDPA